jgi:hypothetical protein
MGTISKGNTLPVRVPIDRERMISSRVTLEIQEEDKFAGFLK